MSRRRLRQPHRRALTTARGVALPVVLVIASMMLVTSAAWFEASLLEARNASAIADHLRAFHAADAALALCTRALVEGSATVPEQLQPGEPAQWRQTSIFEQQAITPAATWRGSMRPPQCLFEPWRIDDRPEARAFLITARGFGAGDDTQSWLQAQVVLEDARVETHWRRVAARPF